MHVSIALRMGKRLDGVVWYQLSLASLNHLLYSGWSHVLRLHKAFHMSGAGAYTCILSVRSGWKCSSGGEAAHPTPIEPVRGISWNITYVSRFGTLYHAGSEWRADSFNKETTDRSDTLLELPHTIPLCIRIRYCFAARNAPIATNRSRFIGFGQGHGVTCGLETTRWQRAVR